MRSMANLICAALRGSSIRSFRPEIGLDDPRMIADVRGASVCELLAVVENGDAVASPHHNLHVVFHKHHRHAGSLNAADKADELTGFRSVQTGSRLVRQNQFWSANECARNFEEPLMPVGQASGNDVRVEDLKVVYANGRPDDIRVRSELREGSETRPLDLKGRDRGIDRIELVTKRDYKGRGKGRAKVCVEGREDDRRRRRG